MKKALTLTLGLLWLSVQILPAQGKASKWLLTKTNNSSFEKQWAADSKHIKSTQGGGEAWLEAPKCQDLREGDCLTFHIPAGKADKGSYVELDFALGALAGSPANWAVEYFDAGKWQLKDTFNCVGGPNEPATVLETFRLDRKPRGKEILVRLRVIGNKACNGKELGSTDDDSHVKLMPYGYIGAYARVLGTESPVDTVRVGYLGNSFTFVNSGDYALKEIAWYEGHYLDMESSTYPGARFRSHIGLKGSMDVISKGGYEWFILQDQSTQAARFGRDATENIISYSKSIAQLIKYFSPDVKVVLEQTWAFSADDYGSFGSYEEFDRCSTTGAAKLSEAIASTGVAKSVVSPIALAFARVRAERPEIELYSTDNHHPAAYGAYLKACVNYVTIFGKPILSDKADFGLDPEICSYLRGIANSQPQNN